MEHTQTADSHLLEEIISGLSRERKSLPSKLFYDEYGSELFDRICELEEYYPTRTELKIMKENIDDIIKYIPPETLFIEFGSGSSVKIKLLLEKLDNRLSAYIPVDISEEHLLKSASNLNFEFPDLDIYPLAADYTQPLNIPQITGEVKRKIAYFPGSTLGNFQAEKAKEFLRVVAEECGSGGGLLIGVDMVKDTRILEAAYNDSLGVTAKFNKNILTRLNREFGFNFDAEQFEHSAPFNKAENRIEMFLISKTNQVVTNHSRSFRFDANEMILTEYSHKYTIETFTNLVSDNYLIEKIWTDDKNYFSVIFLTVK